MPYIAKVQNAYQESLPKHFAGLDMKVCYIWADLREFTRSASLAFQTGQKMPCILFQEILISIQYRLLLLDVNTALHKAIHIGMLAFSTNVFLQMKGLSMRFEALSDRLRDSILELRDLKHDSLIELEMWLLFVERIFIVAGNNDVWPQPEIKKTLVALDLKSWTTVRDRLKDYLWIGVLHDDGGREAFEHAMTSH